jgi:S-adenosylmethionine decarboxylase
VDAAGAKVVTKISNKFMDACILSESSLFVWEDRILIITCGQTKLVRAVPRILEFADPSDIDLLIYARKNQLFPLEQPSSFGDDASYLERLFPGKRHRLGPDDSDHTDLFVFAKNSGEPRRQATFELLMHDIDPAMIETFSVENGNSAARAERLSGISRIYPDMVRDGFLFSPCGYSLNALSGPEYFTVHVTPQKQDSYASFETNVPESDYDFLASQVVDIFRPRRFSMFLTTGIDKKASCLHKALGGKMSGYTLLEKNRHNLFPDYAASFLNFAAIS